MRSTIFFLTIVALLSGACGNDNASQADAVAVKSSAPTQKTSIQWLDSARDYGRIDEGQKLAVSFRFRNSGDKPLIIESVKPTCGCTVADYPKQPIPPGQEGEITGEFDSNGREGLQHKNITIRSNTEPSEQDVSFQVNVVAKQGGQQQNTTFQ